MRRVWSIETILGILALIVAISAFVIPEIKKTSSFPYVRVSFVVLLLSILFFIYMRRKENEKNKEESEQKALENKLLSDNKLSEIDLYTSLEKVRSILGPPDKIYDSYIPCLAKNEINSEVLVYKFENGTLAIISENKLSISTIYIHIFPDVMINGKRINVDSRFMGYKLGELTIGDILANGGWGNAEYTRSMRDAWFICEGYYGRFGNYRNYTFGSSIDIHEYKNDNFLDDHGKEVDVNDTLIEFICISLDSERGGYWL